METVNGIYREHSGEARKGDQKKERLNCLIVYLDRKERSGMTNEDGER